MFGRACLVYQPQSLDHNKTQAKLLMILLLLLLQLLLYSTIFVFCPHPPHFKKIKKIFINSVYILEGVGPTVGLIKSHFPTLNIIIMASLKRAYIYPDVKSV